MIIRVRSKAGTWRIPNLELTSSIHDLQNWIEQHQDISISKQCFYMDAQYTKKLNPSDSLHASNLKNGDMVYLNFEGDYTPSSEALGKKINPDGSISTVTYHDRLKRSGFRPGMKSLRDMKMHWTIGEFVDMDSKFEFKISAQKESHCTKLSIDSSSCNDFQSYLRQFAFQQSRCGWLYGKIQEDNSIHVECIYEPPQQGNPYGFEVFEDPLSEKADFIASSLGLEKVGWVFSHPPREKGFLFTSREILLAAQLQIDSGGKKSPFVTLKVSLDENGNSSFEAFQVSDQSLEMFSAGALLENPDNPTKCLIHNTFTAFVESKPTQEVDNDFFLCTVPVVQHTSFLRCTFPKLNREGNMHNRDVLRAQLNEFKNLPYAKRIADLQILLFLVDFLDIQTDIPIVCKAIQDPDHVQLDSGYCMVIDSVAGL